LHGLAKLFSALACICDRWNFQACPGLHGRKKFKQCAALNPWCFQAIREAWELKGGAIRG
jgi:hypothetical protein